MITSALTEERIDAATAKRLQTGAAFTAAYRAHMDDHVAVREAYCLAEQWPALFKEIRPGDLFAGRRDYTILVGLSQENNCNGDLDCLHDKPGYKLTEADRELREKLGISNSGFCHRHTELLRLAEKFPEGSDERREIEQMVEFWDEHSMRRQYNRALTDEVKHGLSRTTGFDTRLASGFMRQDCYSLDFDKLLQLGIPGLRDLITRKQNEARTSGGDVEFYRGLLMVLDILCNVCKHYEGEARELAETCGNATHREQLLAMADVLDHITHTKPQNLRQAIQLFWLYDLMADTPNYGRMDVYLGDFFCSDIDTGTLTEAQATELLCDLWKLISEIKPEGGPTQPNARLVIGGRGRRNELNANRFAMAAMDVVLKMRVNEPNVTLRFYTGQDRALMDKAITLLGEGRIHPGLYNDDEHVPMVRDWYNVPEADAEQYLPEGCGEILIDHMGFGSPNNIFLFPTALDLVLHNGYETVLREKRGLELGELSSFDTFDKLVDAFKAQVDYTNSMLAKRHAIEHSVEAKHGAFLMMSMLSDDCIERGKSLFNGGVRYLGGIIESFGLTTVADSLAAIRELVYEKKTLTLGQVVDAVDANFIGHEEIQKMLIDCPKYGNDDDRVDVLHTQLSEFVNRSASEAGKREGLHFFLNCNLNPGGLYYCECVKASPDGRVNWEPMPMGNAPTPGRDKCGVTALLNSVSKHVKGHAGYVQNLKINKRMFTEENRPRFEALVDAYFANGGLQLMVTALNKDDLENALREPDKYQHLQVRVAGWTGRFVQLKPHYQQEIINRTMHG